jgi:hypothetical protein
MELQAKEVKSNNLYRQNYCGCMFALSQQRDMQDIYASELTSPISKQILPNSIEERVKLYRLRNQYEEDKLEYKIYKNSIQNYRLLSGGVKVNKKTVPSYILFYSRLKSKVAKVKIEFEQDDIYYMNKNEIKLMTIDILNKRLNTNYENVLDMLNNPPNIDDEVALRDSFDYSPIIILDEVLIDTKYEIKIKSVLFEDTRTMIALR